jgi:hypothetical protein
MTLGEIIAQQEEQAQKKTRSEPEPAPSFILSVNSPSAQNGASNSRNHNPHRAVPPDPPPGQHERLLGTENLADLIPMDWPQSLPERLWQEARYSPVANLSVILSADQTTAWISLCAPGKTPLLLYPLPVHGRLLPNCLPAQCEMLNGSTAGESKSPSFQPTTAFDAGSDGLEPSPPMPASARDTSN